MKERLTGAIILVALMVLLVPELLTGPIRTKSQPAPAAGGASAPGAAQMRRTPQAQPPLRTYTLTLGASPQAQEPQASAGASTPAGTAAHRPAQRSGPAPTQPKPAVAPAPAVQHPAPPQHAGAAAAPAPHRPSTPAARRAAASPAGLQVANTPAHRAQRNTASVASGGWVVQLGSFAERRNAIHLARSLEARGFHLSVSPARAGARVLWRVRTRLVPDRKRALLLAGRLRALGHRGEVLPVR